MMLLENLRLFQSIVENGSLVAAGRELGLSATTVSERLTALERHYGVALLHRTTRSFSLSDEGRTLLSSARQIIEDVDDLDGRLRHGAETLTGTIRITAPAEIGRTIVSDVVADFTVANPAISTELFVSDGLVDLVAEGYDFAMRFGEIADSSLKQRRLGEFKRVICASPDYLTEHGTPQTPQDLLDHNCLLFRFGSNLANDWYFGAGADRVTVKVRGNALVNDGSLVRRWCVAGRGIMRKLELDVVDDIREGRLVEVLTDYAPPPYPFSLLFPPDRSRPRRVQALADALAAEIRGMKAEFS